MELSTSCGCIAVRFGGRWRLVAAGDGRWRALPCPPCSPSPCRPCASWRGLLLPVLLQCQHRPRPPGPSPRPCAHPAQPSSALPPPSSPPCSALARRARLRHCRSQASYSASRPSARAGRRRQSYQDPLPSRLPRLARLALAFCPSCRVVLVGHTLTRWTLLRRMETEGCFSRGDNHRNKYVHALCMQRINCERCKLLHRHPIVPRDAPPCLQIASGPRWPP
jgi:hypothetical protein